MTVAQALPATAESFALAEGPVWDAARARLLWVDILAGEVLTGVLDGVRVNVTDRLEVGGLVGAVTIAADGRLLVAAHDRLATVGADGSRVDGPVLLPDAGAQRLNDGKTDPAGRFLVGSLALGPATGRESLLSIAADGTVTTLDDDLSLSNGLAWSADGSLLYSIDTFAHVVWVRDYDVATGRTGPRRLHLRVDDGFPDGMCADVDDHLWIAVWGRGEVRRFAPDGTLVRRIVVPAPHTSSVAFVGPALDRLVITTATSELTDDDLARYPLSGHLFTADAEVPGVPVAPWQGTLAAAT